jgi:hypothetical protein
MDLGFKLLLSFVFSPVSAAIFGAKESLKISKNGDMKIAAT